MFFFYAYFCGQNKGYVALLVQSFFFASKKMWVGKSSTAFVAEEFDFPDFWTPCRVARELELRSLGD